MGKTRKKLPSRTTELKPAKARQILKEGRAQGKPLTKKQKGFFGAVAGKGKKK